MVDKISEALTEDIHPTYLSKLEPTLQHPLGEWGRAGDADWVQLRAPQLPGKAVVMERTRSGWGDKK